MGWYGEGNMYTNERTMYGKIKSYAKDYVVRVNGDETGRFNIDDYAIKKNVLYISAREKETGKVIAVVSLFHLIDGELMVKTLGEEDGPNAIDCPKKILKTLTATDSEYANEWREKCWSKYKKKFEDQFVMYFDIK